MGNVAEVRNLKDDVCMPFALRVCALSLALSLYAEAAANRPVIVILSDHIDRPFCESGETRSVPVPGL